MHGWQANPKTHLRSASEQGLCPKNKNHVLCTWRIIVLALVKDGVLRKGHCFSVCGFAALGIAERFFNAKGMISETSVCQLALEIAVLCYIAVLAACVNRRLKGETA